ncbi:citrate lyase subunit beta [Amycolatopsis deserti]|uniref:Citrate lyase subunit beta n=1 Tax=Amycolatopsis deserti TaxID=185696 RepID=A0ABQ3IQP3_9PSEU|nr:CoA ester lyase [Amycolatopsis deserti]GHE91561.1 citrate lyase subunit beta [Amycolatopsis deserti]
MTVRRRSYLVTPATSTRMIGKAAHSAADVVVLDLEDGVSPDRKDEARRIAAEVSRDPVWSNRLLAVRINQPGTGMALSDLSAVLGSSGSQVDLVVVPKVVAPRDVWWVDTTLTELDSQLGIEHGVGIQVLVEDVAAIERLTEIARSSDRIESLVFGPGDFSASMDADLAVAGNDRQDLYPGDVWHSVRTAISLAAHTAGVAAVDGAYGDIGNLDGYRRECVWSRTLGFTGKWAIHPAQIEIANDVYAPSREAIAAAERMVAAYDAAVAGGDGAAAHDGHLIDAATLRTARAVLDTAAALGLRGRHPQEKLTESRRP